MEICLRMKIKQLHGNRLTVNLTQKKLLKVQNSKLESIITDSEIC